MRRRRASERKGRRGERGKGMRYSPHPSPPHPSGGGFLPFVVLLAATAVNGGTSRRSRHFSRWSRKSGRPETRLTFSRCDLGLF